MTRPPYAVDPDHSRGRLYLEPEALSRSPFERDRARILHSAAWRKLQHKTQVFVSHEGDFYRTRLTHSLEVAQISRSIARRLGLDEDLTEALALAHDLGHPPFGHAGEAGLNEAARAWGGFDHNAQSLRVVTELERRYAGFDGLNLSWETLEGLAKHNGPLSEPPAAIALYDQRHKLDLASHAAAEAQTAALADDIAYYAHDLDDGLRAGLFSFEEVGALPLVGEAVGQARRLGACLSPSRLRHETIRQVIDRLISDVIEESSRRLAALSPRDAQEIRTAPNPVVGFSPSVAQASARVKSFLTERMYRHWRALRMARKAKALTAELFALLHEDPTMLPPEWAERAGVACEPERAVVVIDYVAGMTDRFALSEYRRLTDLAEPG